MGTFGRTWEALGVQSGALGAFFGIQVSSGIFDRLLSQIYQKLGRVRPSPAGCAVPAEGGEASPPSLPGPCEFKQPSYTPLSPLDEVR